MTASTDHSLFEEKGEPKRNRTEVLPLASFTARLNRLTNGAEALLLTSLIPYRWAKPAEDTDSP